MTAIASSEVPMATRSGYAKRSTRSGTTTAPPPTPNSPLNSPAAEPTAASPSIRRGAMTGHTSGPSRNVSAAYDGRRSPPGCVLDHSKCTEAFLRVCVLARRRRQPPFPCRPSPEGPLTARQMDVAAPAPPDPPAADRPPLARGELRRRIVRGTAINAIALAAVDLVVLAQGLIVTRLLGP